MLWRSVEKTASGLGADAQNYRSLVEPYLEHADGLLEDFWVRWSGSRITLCSWPASV